MQIDGRVDAVEQVGSGAVVPRVWVEIDLDMLAKNYQRISQTVDPCFVIAVLKANAYGLGVEAIARRLVAEGCEHFGVAEMREAITLQGLAAHIHVLGAVMPDEIAMGVAADVVMPVDSYETAMLIDQAAKSAGKLARIQFLVDSGMGRLGVLLEHAYELVLRCCEFDHLQPVGFYSHFPVAYQRDGDYTRIQIEKMNALLMRLSEAEIDFPWRHIANSDAINNVPSAYAEPYNAVRTGINLYGAFDPLGAKAMQLSPVLTLKTRLAAVRELPAGSAIGYGCTYKLPRKMRVGTVAAGYADGLPLALSNRGYVLIQGQACPIIGRISMDYTTVSLESLPAASVGDEVICIGGSGARQVSVEDWAAIKGTHPYDVICSLGNRVARKYVS